jgi:NitT/TauT family transport system substrate-binding protein
MKIRAIILSCFFTVLTISSCSKRDDSVLRFGYLQSDLHHLPAFVAIEKGFFAAQGLKVEVGGVFKAGPEEMSAFGAGELDFGYMGQAPATAALLNGVADIQFIAQVNLEGSAIVARKGAEAASLKNLTGKTVAFPGYATMQDFLLRRALKNTGMTIQNIKPIVLKPPEMQQALELKHIDAFIAWQPYPAQALSSGGAQVVLDSSAIWQDHPCCVLIARREVAQSRPEDMRRLRAAHAQACAFIAQHPDEALSIGIKYTSMNSGVVQEAMRRIRYTDKLDRQRSREFVDFLIENKYIKKFEKASERFGGAFFD